MFFEGLFGRESMPLLEQAASFTEQRHRVLVNNIASADLPGYQARDLDQKDFRHFLQEAIARRTLKGTPFESYRSVRLSREGMVRPRPVVNRKRDPLRHDRNNVSVDAEMVRMAQNGMRHNAMVQLLRQKYIMIGKAIQGRTV